MLWQPVNQDSVTQLRGMVVRTGSSPSNVVLAKADVSNNCANLVGVRPVDVGAGSAGIVAPFSVSSFVRLVSEPGINDTIYLSATVDGCGTNVAPTIQVPLGVVYEKSQVGGVWYALIIPSGSILGERVTGASKFLSPSTREIHVGNVANAYATLEAALVAVDNLVPAASSANPVAVIVHPGEYTPANTLVIKSGVGIIGVDGGLVGISGAFDIFSIAGDDVYFANFHSITANAPSTFVFKCNDHNYINISNVGQWRNGTNIQGFLEQVGSGWHQLSMGRCLVDSRVVNTFAIRLIANTARYVDVEIDDCFIDAWYAGASGGCFEVQFCQDLRFFKSKIRCAPSGTGVAVSGAGAWIEMQAVAGVKADGSYGNLLNVGAGASARYAYCDGTTTGAGTITVIGGSTVPGPPGPAGPQGPAGPAAGLTTAYDLDLSTLAAATYNSDGVKTLDGRAAWRLKNAANGQLIALNDGTHAGLYTRCSTFNSTNYGTGYNGPRWVIGLNDLCGVNPRDCTEQWVLYMFSQPHVPNANYEYAYFGISALPGADTDTNHSTSVFELARGYSNGLTTIAEWQKDSTVNQAPSGTTLPLTTDDVYAFRILANDTIEAYSGASVAGAFPAVTALRYVGRAKYLTQVQGYVTDGPVRDQNFQWAAVLSIAQSNTVGASDMLLKKIKILYR